MVDLTPETQELLNLMTYSTAASLRRELQRQDYALAEADADEGALLANALQRRDFLESIAFRLPGELHSLFWVEVTESLIARGRCVLNNFGTFERKADRVHLEARGVLLTGSAPEVEGTSNVNFRIAMEACDQELRPYVAELDDWYEPTSVLTSFWLFTVKLLLQKLDRAMVRFSTVLSEAQSSGPWHIFRGGTESGPSDGLRGTGGFIVQARAVAYATYYSYVAGFGRALARGSSLEVPTVGAFRLDKENASVQFTAEDGFLRLISANSQSEMVARA